MKTDELILYRNPAHKELVEAMAALIDAAGAGSESHDDFPERSYEDLSGKRSANSEGVCV